MKLFLGPPSDAEIDARVLGIAAATVAVASSPTNWRALRDWAQSCLKCKDMETGVWRTEEEARAAVPETKSGLRVLAADTIPIGRRVRQNPQHGRKFSFPWTVADLFPTDGGETFLRRAPCAPKAVPPTRTRRMRMPPTWTRILRPGAGGP